MGLVAGEDHDLLVWNIVIAVMAASSLVALSLPSQGGISLLALVLLPVTAVFSCITYVWKGFILAALLAVATMGTLLIPGNDPAEALLGASLVLATGAVAAIATERVFRIRRTGLTTRCQAALDLVPYTILSIDRSLHLATLNKAGLGLFGLNPGTVDHILPFLSFIAPQDRDRVLGALEALHIDATPGCPQPDRETLTCTVISRNGHSVPVRLTIAPLSGLSVGEGTIGVIEDESEHLAFEDELVQLSEFWEMVIDDAATWITVADSHMQVSVWNKAAEAISGYRREDVTGRGLFDQIVQRDELREAIMDHIRAELEAKGKVEGLEVVIQCSNGDERILLWNIRAMSWQGGSPTAYVVLARDITLQRELEGEKHEALTQINRNLIQLAILNDSIRNPLQQIVGYVDLEGSHSLMTKVLESARDIDAIIGRLDTWWLESQKISEFLRRHYGTWTGEESKGMTGSVAEETIFRERS
jgi:PAS domain S-box-containing protein